MCVKDTGRHKARGVPWWQSPWGRSAGNRQDAGPHPTHTQCTFPLSAILERPFHDGILYPFSFPKFWKKTKSKGRRGALTEKIDILGIFPKWQTHPHSPKKVIHVGKNSQIIPYLLSVSVTDHTSYLSFFVRQRILRPLKIVCQKSV